jgi:hypothetical protein
MSLPTVSSLVTLPLDAIPAFFVLATPGLILGFFAEALKAGSAPLASAITRTLQARTATRPNR